MGRIYEVASNTVIYLGPADVKSEEYACIASVRENREFFSREGFNLILENEWFARVWVFHELVFASNPWVQVGRVRAKWQSQLIALENNFGHATHGNEKYAIASEMHGAWQDYSIARTKTEILRLVQARRGLGVSDPRDMVFADVGFASDGDDEHLTVDYLKTLLEIFSDFARYVVHKYGFSTLLELVGDAGSPKRNQDLPSWVIDLTSDASDRIQANQVYIKDYRPIGQIMPIIWTSENHSPVVWGRKVFTIIAMISELVLDTVLIDRREKIASGFISLWLGFATSENLARYEEK